MKRAATTTLLALAVLCTVGSCGPAANVELTVDKTPAVGPLQGLLIVLRKANSNTPTVYGPIDLTKSGDTALRTDVTPGQEFYFDVFGCSSPSDCTGANVVARGCHNLATVNQGEQKAIAVTLYPSPGEYDLPPQPGVVDPEKGCPPYGPHTRPPPP